MKTQSGKILAITIIALFAGASISHAGFGALADMAKKKAAEEANKATEEAKKQATEAASKAGMDALKAGAEALYGDEDVEEEEDVQEAPQKQYQPPQQKTSRSAQTAQQVYMLPDNFTKGERWGTWALNTVIPGLGSGVIMNDYLGMGIQIGLAVPGIIFMRLLLVERRELEAADMDGYYAVAGSVLLLGDIIFNIVRSYSYDKPTNDRHGSNEYGGFNLAVLPNRRGEAMPYLMYNKTF